ncbi:TAXI family TRAP transporter solute-binding subunit [Chloroflexota bacterium]
MTKLKWFLNIVLVLIMVAGLLVTACAKEQEAPKPAPAPAPKPAPAPAPKPAPAPPKEDERAGWPKVASIAGTSVGSSKYAQASAFAIVMTRELGIPVSPEVFGGDSAAVAISKKELEFSIGGDYYLNWSILGTGVEAWKGQSLPIRGIANVGLHVRGFVVNANSDIYTLADVKGKRYCWPSYSQSANVLTDGWLASAGLTLDDVVARELTSTKAGRAALIEGSVDIYCGVIGSPLAPNSSAMQMDQAIGVRQIAMTEEEARALQEATKIFYVVKMPGGFLSGNPEPFWSVAGRWGIYTGSHLPDDFIYAVTKAFWENTEDLGKMLVDYKEANYTDRLANLPGILHAGAIKYYKEIGAWTPEMEKNNQYYLELIGEEK